MNEAKNIEKTPEVVKKISKKLTNGRIMVIVVAILFFWLIAVQIMAADRYKAVVSVIAGENKVGVNPTTEKLDFGDLSPDSSLTRYITVSNQSRSAKYILVWKLGAISDLLTINKSSFTLAAAEEAKVEFNVKIPISAPLQKYSGTIMIFKLPKVF